MTVKAMGLADDGQGYKALVDFASEHMTKLKDTKDAEALRVAASTLVSEVASEVAAETAAETAAEAAAETAAEFALESIGRKA